MKWTKLCGAVLAMLGLVGSANAGTCAPLGGHGADKGCGCAPAYQPCTSKPVICRPNHRNVCTYQRSCSKQACGSCAPTSGSGGTNGAGCGSNGAGCGSNGAACVAKAASCDKGCGKGWSLFGCGPKKSCDKGCGSRCVKPCAAKCAPAADPGCAAPAKCAPVADPGCAAPAKCAPVADPGCAAPAKCAKVADPGCAAPARCAKVADPGCAAPAPAKACDAGATKATRCCVSNAAEVAQLIYESQTGCYARNRRRALIKLGRFECACNPEIMCAFAHALNDCDENVRKEAAQQIHKQTRKNTCCCSQTVVAALTNALADCDRGVRRAAERALESCGYEVKNCHESKCCPPANRCVAAATNCAPSAAPTTAPAASPYAPPATEAAPAVDAPADETLAPAPAEAEPAAYFPSRLKTQNKAKKSGLANLFGLRS